MVYHPDGKWENVYMEEGQIKIIKYCIGNWEWRGELVTRVPLEFCGNGFHPGRLISSVHFSCLCTDSMHKFVIHPPTLSENDNGACWSQLLHTLHANKPDYCTNQRSHGQPWRNTARALFACFLKLSPQKYSAWVQSILCHRRIWSAFCLTSFQSAVILIVLGKEWTKAPTGHGEAIFSKNKIKVHRARDWENKNIWLQISDLNINLQMRKQSCFKAYVTILYEIINKCSSYRDTG